MIATLIGGIGLFLLGMILMTDGLRAAAGDALRHTLSRLTGGPARAVAAGVGATALVQSSSATLLTTIGFVSAGLLTFPQAVGLVFGANLGTTSTGWIVSLLGFKLNITAVALPLVGVGALARLLGRDRIAAFGLALAGFGLIFVGIDTLQAGMQGLERYVDPARISPSTTLGRVGLVGIGALMTVIMQSSSAAMATTLTAVHAGALDLSGAAPLVIGQNLGTTVTALIAAIGASVPAKRTAVAHTLFNALAGAVAFLLLPVFPAIAAALGALATGDDAAVALAGFHTAFNVAGVALLLPVAGPFARLVERMVPDRGAPLTRHLDDSVLAVPEVAVEAARRAAASAGAVLVGVAADSLTGGERRRRGDEELGRAEAALIETRDFLGRVRTPADSSGAYARHVSVLHALDHLQRLRERIPGLRTARPDDDPDAAPLIRRAAGLIGPAAAALAGEGPELPAAELEALSREIATARKRQRRSTLDATAGGAIDPEAALHHLRAMRFLDAVVYHAWRAAAHLGAADPLQRVAAG